MNKNKILRYIFKCIGLILSGVSLANVDNISNSASNWAFLSCVGITVYFICGEGKEGFK